MKQALFDERDQTIARMEKLKQSHETLKKMPTTLETND